MTIGEVIVPEVAVFLVATAATMFVLFLAAFVLGKIINRGLLRFLAVSLLAGFGTWVLIETGLSSQGLLITSQAKGTLFVATLILSLFAGKMGRKVTTRSEEPTLDELRQRRSPKS
jgi:hypothetical protein